jgi:hypothetical protein
MRERASGKDVTRIKIMKVGEEQNSLVQQYKQTNKLDGVVE